MNNNVNILDELNKGCCMGVDAINLIVKKANDKEFIKLLEELKEKYLELSGEINKTYKEYSDDEIHETGMMTKAMTWYGIEKDTILDDSTSKLADLMINGTNMGIIEGRKIINNKKMDKNIKHISEEYIKIQEEYLDKLKKYL